MKRFAGIFILLAVVGVVGFLLYQNGGKPGGNAPTGMVLPGVPGKEIVRVKGLIGGEKTQLLKDPDVIQILRDRYNLELDFDRRGSLEMVREDQPPDRDFLWPSSQVALDFYKSSGKPMVKNEILLNSPIVLYSWGPVTDALTKKGIVEKRGDSYYVVDMPKLVATSSSGKTWKEIGLTQLYGRIVIYSTDPNLSNSGNMFAGLLANILNSGQVVTEASLPKVTPTVKKFFEEQGFMEQSSDVIFKQFLNKGMGDKPLIVGYESQMIEYSLVDAARFTQRKAEVRTLYPQPTVWSSHPLIALTDNGAKLLEALQDKDIQRLAWEKHGFRSAVGAENDPAAVQVAGIPANIENVIPMPRSRVMEKLLQSLE